MTKGPFNSESLFWSLKHAWLGFAELKTMLFSDFMWQTTLKKESPTHGKSGHIVIFCWYKVCDFLFWNPENYLTRPTWQCSPQNSLIFRVVTQQALRSLYIIYMLTVSRTEEKSFYINETRLSIGLYFQPQTK